MVMKALLTVEKRFLKISINQSDKYIVELSTYITKVVK